MIVLTVVLAVLVASYALGFTARAAGPTATLEVRATKENDNVINLTIIHRGGDPLKTSELVVYAENSENKMMDVTWAMPETLNPGEESAGTYTHGNNTVKIGMSVTVRVIHNPSGTALFDAKVTVKKK
jgi:FlaG/FlaF family flagellin (archaellin)